MTHPDPGSGPSPQGPFDAFGRPDPGGERIGPIRIEARPVDPDPDPVAEAEAHSAQSSTTSTAQPTSPPQSRRRRSRRSSFGRLIARTFRGVSDSPLTDPRALAATVLVHAILLILGSWVALGGASFADRRSVEEVRAMLGPVENRDAGGEDPLTGNLGNRGPSAPTESPSLSIGSESVLDEIAEGLMADLLPSSPDLQLAPSPPLGTGVSGIGIKPSETTAFGQGTGRAPGGGSGSGTSFFGAEAQGRSFVYVIDRSGSMTLENALEVAKRELLQSLNQLPADVEFGVVFYNFQAEVFGRSDDLMDASPANKQRVRQWLGTVQPNGATNHMRALRTGLALKSEVLYFLTDGDLLSNYEAEQIMDEAGLTRIQAIRFGVGPSTDLVTKNPLERLAEATGGAYRYIDVYSFRRLSASSRR